MIHFCACAKEQFSDQRILKLLDGLKLCGSCGGKLPDRDQAGFEGTMLSTMGVGLSGALDPQVNWKTASKGRQRAVRRARTSFTEANNRDLKSSKESDDSTDNDSKRKQDVLSSESEKLGVSVLGQHFSNTQKFYPIKKRRQMFFGYSSPPQDLSLSDDSCQNSPILCSEVVEKLDRRMHLRQDKKINAGESLRLKELNMKLPEVVDFSGIAILATVACETGVGSSIEKEEESIYRPVCVLENPAKEVGMPLENNTTDGHLSLCKDRLHWDLNAPIDAWESPNMDTSRKERHLSREIPLHISKIDDAQADSEFVLTKCSEQAIEQDDADRAPAIHINHRNNNSAEKHHKSDGCSYLKEEALKETENFNKAAKADLPFAVTAPRQPFDQFSSPPTYAAWEQENADRIFQETPESKVQTFDSILCGYGESGFTASATEPRRTVDFVEAAHVQRADCAECQVVEARKDYKSSPCNHSGDEALEGPLDCTTSGGISRTVSWSVKIEEDGFHESNVVVPSTLNVSCNHEVTPCNGETPVIVKMKEDHGCSVYLDQNFDSEELGLEINAGPGFSSEDSISSKSKVDLLCENGGCLSQGGGESFYDSRWASLPHPQIISDQITELENIEVSAADDDDDDDSQYEDGEVRESNMNLAEGTSECVNDDLAGQVTCFSGSVFDPSALSGGNTKRTGEQVLEADFPLYEAYKKDPQVQVTSMMNTNFVERAVKDSTNFVVGRENQARKLEADTNCSLERKTSVTKLTVDEFVEKSDCCGDLNASSSSKLNLLSSSEFVEVRRITSEGVVDSINKGESSVSLEGSSTGEASRSVSVSIQTRELHDPVMSLKFSSVTQHKKCFGKAKRIDGSFRVDYGIDRNSRDEAPFSQRGSGRRRGTICDESSDHLAPDRRYVRFYPPGSFKHSGSRNAVEETAAKLKSSGFVITPDGTILKAGSRDSGGIDTGRPSNSYSHGRNHSRVSRMERRSPFRLPLREESVEGPVDHRQHERTARYGAQAVGAHCRARDRMSVVDSACLSIHRSPSSRRDRSFFPRSRYSRSRTRSPLFWRSPRRSAMRRNEAPRPPPRRSKSPDFLTDPRLESQSPNWRLHSERQDDYLLACQRRKREYIRTSSHFREREHIEPYGRNSPRRPSSSGRLRSDG